MGALDGRIAVVTGAGQGIGREYATALATDGAAVVVADLNEASALETARAIEASGGTALAVKVDVSDAASVDELRAAVQESFGTAHILVNNAAVYAELKSGPLMQVDMAYWRHVFAVNVEGPLLCVQALAPFMIEAGWGRVVNQVSVGAYMGHGSLYSVTKLALVGLTQGMARELGPHGITANAIAPGTIHTDATLAVVKPEMRDQMLSRQYIPKPGMPSDLVGTLLFFVGEGAAWVTGQTVFVDGGAVPRV